MHLRLDFYEFELFSFIKKLHSELGMLCVAIGHLNILHAINMQTDRLI